MRAGSACAGLLVLLTFVGCDGSSQSVTPAKRPDLKAVLTQIAESGSLEDMQEVLSTHLEKLEETNAEKAKELTADYEALRKATSPAKVTEHAKKMADKL